MSGYDAVSGKLIRALADGHAALREIHGREVAGLKDQNEEQWNEISKLKERNALQEQIILALQKEKKALEESK